MENRTESGSSPRPSPSPGGVARWYRGDFHVHTCASADEAVYPLRLLAGIAEVEGLDFIAITDHNTIEGLSQPSSGRGVLVVPGVEVTLDEGDFNVFGVTGRDDWMDGLCTGAPRVSLPPRYSSTTDLMARTEERRLLNSINHPCLPPWEWRDRSTDLRHVHCLEVWNDPYWPGNEQGNPDAVTLWTEWLDAGHRITAIGGSDYHHPPRPEEGKPGERLGLPSTYVWARDLSVRAILEGLRQRRAYVSVGPRLAFTARAGGATYDIGADLPDLRGPIRLRAEVAHSGREALRARIVSSSEVHAAAWMDNQGRALDVEVTVSGDSRRWYRLEVASSAGELLALTNPIFVGPPREPRLTQYGDFRP